MIVALQIAIFATITTESDKSIKLGFLANPWSTAVALVVIMKTSEVGGDLGGD